MAQRHACQDALDVAAAPAVDLDQRAVAVTRRGHLRVGYSGIQGGVEAVLRACALAATRHSASDASR